MSNLLSSFKTFITTNGLFQPSSHLIIAVSGGMDSVVLAQLCSEAGYDFTIAHCNFQLRAAESERDEKFVAALSERLGVVFNSRRFDTTEFAASNKLSIQVAARQLRYEWFEELRLANKNKSSAILTAHHADDNVETVLMNFFKGTGIAGLRGILPKHGNLIRPLLFATREEIQLFATDRKLEWVEDSSNASNKYSRNLFRNEIIPAIKTVYPAAIDNVLDNLSKFREIETLYHQAIDLHKKSIIEKKGEELHLPVLKLKRATPLASILYEILKDFNFSSQQTQEVIALLDSESGKYVASPTHRVLRNRKWLIIAPNQSSQNGMHVIDGTGKFQVPAGTLLVQPTAQPDFISAVNNYTVYVDSKLLKFPLLLRPASTGDYFYPLGMDKKKKISRFLIDQKLSRSQKEKVLVVESDRKIVWVVGMRIDNRFKIVPATTQFLQLTWIEKEKGE